MNLLGWLGAGGVTQAEVRAEVWRLGARHRGEPLEGALRELTDQSISPARASLLRACVQQLRRA
ncbi:MAG: hypothetical protein JWP28_1712 [Phenylobacterium sp.]|jgi:hypothetical protein|uniref:hypothetical protein n=1 Tax=Phenylobacterium sp. TaxID=1871053 RepID=UPI002623C7B6|nr:hypothetical protein [Phenylobacterium sp.]MDB5497681.1 hypothetical protein [Phenylobacterium sp.]